MKQIISTLARIALVAQNAVEGEATEGEMFIYTQYYQPFTEAYKPYVPEPKTVKLEQYVIVTKRLKDGFVFFEETQYDSEEEAREYFEDVNGTYALFSVAKIEWEGTVE